MNKNQKLLLVTLGIIITTVGVFSFINTNISAVNYPPTPAYSKIIINGEEFKADTFDETMIINFTGSLVIESSGPNDVTITLDPISCPALQGIKGVDENGFLFCAAI